MVDSNTSSLLRVKRTFWVSSSSDQEHEKNNYICLELKAKRTEDYHYVYSIPGPAA